MSEIDFPIGVELPLRGGGVAVLYEFFENRWYGRMKPTRAAIRWVEGMWFPDGSDGGTACEAVIVPGMVADYRGRSTDILPPKRKAWVVWNDGMPLGVFADSIEAHKYSMRTCGISTIGPNAYLQEITEP